MWIGIGAGKSRGNWLQRPWNVSRTHQSPFLWIPYGIKANEYYEAKATRDNIALELSKSDAERRAVDQALRQIRERMVGASLIFDLAAFAQETDRIVAESQKLHQEQATYRNELARLNEEYQLWRDHVAVVEAGLREVSDAFSGSIDHPPDVECPMCGQHYSNRIADQFDLKADEGELVLALEAGQMRINAVSARIAEQRQKLARIASAIDSIQAVLAVRHQDVTFKDVVAAEGRNEAIRVLQEQMTALDSKCAEIQGLITASETRMRSASSRDRKRQIENSFAESLVQSAKKLDVRLSEKKSIQGVNIGRGSEGPRALAAYYYAFLNVVHEYGSCVYCPIVIDAPNQQGQDRRHLTRIMEFLLAQVPPDSQVIIGSEALISKYEADADLDILQIGWRKKQSSS